MRIGHCGKKSVKNLRNTTVMSKQNLFSGLSKRTGLSVREGRPIQGSLSEPSTKREAIANIKEKLDTGHTLRSSNPQLMKREFIDLKENMNFHTTDTNKC